MKALAAALVLLTAGCGDDRIADPPAGAIIDERAREFIRDPGPKPFLVTYRPARAGGPDAFRMAIMSGVLDFAGRCVRLQESGGSLRTIVTSAGSGLKRDSMGWFLPSGRDRLRHGSSIAGGGGELSSVPPAEMLAADAPAECRQGPAVELIGVRRPDVRL